MIVSSDPPIIAFSSSGEKDTLANIRVTSEFVYNHVSDALAAAMNLSSADFPPGTSEFDWTGLTPVPSAVVGAPRVGESPAALECCLRDIQEFGHGPSYLIIGDVAHIAVDPDLLIDGILDNTRTRPVGRLARTQYTHSRAFFDLERRPTVGCWRRASSLGVTDDERPIRTFCTTRGNAVVPFIAPQRRTIRPTIASTHASCIVRWRHPFYCAILSL